MDKSTSLYRLIHSLDKQEISLVRKSLKNKEKALQLFNLYQQEKKGLNNEQFKKKEKKIKNLAVIKSRLYGAIMNELVIQNSINNDKIYLNNIDNNILILSKKGLFNEVLQEIKKGYRYAEKLGDAQYLLLFTKRLLQARIPLSDKDIPREWITDEGFDTRLMSYILDLYIIKNHLFENKKYNETKQGFNVTPNIQMNDEIVQNLLPTTKVSYYSWQANASDFKDKETSLFLFIKALDVYKEVDMSEVKGSFLKNSFYTLNLGVIHKAIQFGYEDISELYLDNLIKHLEANNESLDAKILWPIECVKILFLCKFKTDRKDEIRNLIHELIYNNKKDESTNRGLNYYLFPICQAYFIIDDEDLFFEYAYMLFAIQKTEKEFSESLYYQTRILELMYNFERKKTKHNIKLVQTLKNYLWKLRGNLHPFEKEFFKLFSNTLLSVSKKETILLISRLEMELQTKETQDFLIREMPYVNFNFWFTRIKQNYR